MKITEILTESPTALVARYYKDANSEFDSKFNTDAAEYKAKNAALRDELFKTKGTGTPVVRKPTSKDEKQYTNQPIKDMRQSSGYRGLNYALAAAGLPCDPDTQGPTSDRLSISAEALNAMGGIAGI